MFFCRFLLIHSEIEKIIYMRDNMFRKGIFLLIFLPLGAVTATGQSKKYLNDMAAFLAGTEKNQASSQLREYMKTIEYSEYQKNISQVWEQYAAKNLRAIAEWKKAHLNPGSSGHLFYAYSGPDLLNALLFFPQMKEYTLAALEKPGNIDSIEDMKKKNVVAELAEIQKTLKTFFKVNYFRTNEMKEDIRQNSFTSVSNLMFFFLSRLGYEIESFKAFELNKKGELEDKKNAKGYDHGFEIMFRKPGEKELKRVRYFRVNFFDDTFRKSPFRLHIEQYKNFNVMLKAASYLMHETNSILIRNFLVSRADFILQDDSGIPIKYFSEKEWDFKYYGQYRVLKMFLNVHQSKLARHLKENSAGALPFQYGYGALVRTPNLMVGKRK